MLPNENKLRTHSVYKNSYSPNGSSALRNEVKKATYQVNFLLKDLFISKVSDLDKQISCKL